MIPILGMHRSGTSALAGALYHLGAEMGAETSWISPASDNPKGFFEYEPIVELNREIFLEFGGTWSTPPAFPRGWTTDGRSAKLRQRAQQLSDQLPPRMVVKDPRLSLTQPLWDLVGGTMPSVLCLRHPSAVAASLRRRNEFDLDQSLLLWFRYTAASLVNRPDSLYVHYDRLLDAPEAQLRRVAEHIGLTVTDANVAAASESIRNGMKHNEPTELAASPIADVCTALHQQLLDDDSSAPQPDLTTWGRLITELPLAASADREIQLLQRTNRALENRLEELAQQHQALNERMRRLEGDLLSTVRLLDAASIDNALDSEQKAQQP